MSTAVLTPDLVLSQRSKSAAREPGLIRPWSGPIIKALMDSAPMQARVDESRMYAAAVISTPVEDRSEDIVEPLGCQLEAYRRNPVVLFEHGLTGLNFPVGKSRRPDGELDMSITDEGITAGCWFSQSSYEADQVFRLVAEDIIRATSIGFRPITARVRRKGIHPERPGLHVTEWELFEWSWVCVGDNPEAIAKILDRGKIGGRGIYEPILKSLLAVAPARKAIATGVNMSKTATTPEAKAGDEPAGVETDTILKAAAGSETPAGGGTEQKTATPPEGEDADDEANPDEAPLGAQVLASAYAGISGLASSISAAVGPLEHPAVKEFVGTLADGLSGLMSEVEGCYSKNYPDAPGIGGDGEDEDAAAMKGLLARGASARLRLKGLVFRLKHLASTATGLKQHDRDGIEGIADRIGSLIAEARDEAHAAAVRKAAADAANKSAAGASTDSPDSLAKVFTPETLKSLSAVAEQIRDGAMTIKASIPAGK